MAAQQTLTLLVLVQIQIAQPILPSSLMAERPALTQNVEVRYLGGQLAAKYDYPSIENRMLIENTNK